MRSDFAILSVGAVSVAIYATETTKGAEYRTRDAEVRLIFVGRQAQYDKVKSFIAAQEQLETIVAFDDEVAIEGDEPQSAWSWSTTARQLKW